MPIDKLGKFAMFFIIWYFSLNGAIYGLKFDETPTHTKHFFELVTVRFQPYPS